MKEEFIQWNPFFATGIEIVDEQHKELVRICNELDSFVSKGAEGNTSEEGNFDKIIADIVAYVQLHFKTEEDLMADMQMPEREAHKEKHEAFVARVGSILEAPFKSSFNKAYTLLLLVKEWFVDHIIYEDKIIGYNYKEKMQS